MRPFRLSTLALALSALTLPSLASANGATVTHEVLSDEGCVMRADGIEQCTDLQGVLHTVITPSGHEHQSVMGDLVVTLVFPDGTVQPSEVLSIHHKVHSGPDGIIVEHQVVCDEVWIGGELVQVTDIRLHRVNGELRVLDFGAVCN